MSHFMFFVLYLLYNAASGSLPIHRGYIDRWLLMGFLRVIVMHAFICSTRRGRRSYR